MSDVQAENVIQTEEAFFDSVIADLDKPADPENLSDEIDDLGDDETGDKKSDEASSEQSKSDAPTSHDKRKNQNRAQERIQQVIAQKNLAESKYNAAIERLELANDKISLLESQIAAYEPVIKEFNDFKQSFMDTGEIPDNISSGKPTGTLDENKPLTLAEYRKITQEEEKLKQANADKAREAELLADENRKLVKDWTPHVKKLDTQDVNPDKKLAFTKFFAKAKDDKQRRELVKVLGKYDNALEIVYGMSKKQGFESLSLAEQVEIAVKLDNKIIHHKQKTTDSAATGNDSKIKKDLDRPSSYEEYIKKRYG